MTAVKKDDTPATIAEDPGALDDHDDSVTVLAVVSIALSGLGFLTLLRLADRRDRTPARALGLFLVTWLETLGGTVLGIVATSRATDSERPGKGLLLGASGSVLGIVTAVLNFNWMRTRRRL